MAKPMSAEALEYFVTYFQETGTYPSLDYMKKTYGVSSATYNETVKLNNKAVARSDTSTNSDIINRGNLSNSENFDDSWGDASWEYVDPYTGEIKTINIGGANYKYDNAFRTSGASDVYYAWEYMLMHGNDVTEEEVLNYIRGKVNHSVYDSEAKEIIHDARVAFSNAGIDLDDLGTERVTKYYNKDTGGVAGAVDYVNNAEPSTGGGSSTEDEEDVNYIDKAGDVYWNELFSLDKGTLGADMLNRLTTAEQNAALSNMQLADAQFQQASMQQAAVVKDIVDQVKAERNAKLRAGMSEAQIANQDMQIMLNNMNTMNQQMNTMNQNRLAAQQQHGLAQDTAYQAYLQNAQGLAQSGAAYSAANAGDPYYQALRYSLQTGKPLSKSYEFITGYNNNTTK